METFFNTISRHRSNSLPFVVYRKPNETTIKALLQKTSDLNFTKDFKEKGFVFSPFDTRENSVLIPIDDSEVISVSSLIYNSDNVDVKLNEIQSDNPVNSSESKAFHINLIKKGIAEIKQTRIKKVVLSRHEKVDVDDANPITIFKKLLKTYKSAFVYCWFHPKVGMWLGATPETLIKIEGRQFSIMALAGTQNYKGTLDVEWKDKEKEEQNIVTNFIVEELKPLVEKVKTSETETVKAGNLLHLKTMISARLKANSSLKDVVSVLHPTPAVCGYPKQDAKSFILENEDYNREFYTGFLGELNFDLKKSPRSGKRNIENRAYALTKKSTQLYVNLRCMQLKDDKAVIYVGGGITASSNPEDEWEETISKSLVIKTVLN